LEGQLLPLVFSLTVLPLTFGHVVISHPQRSARTAHPLEVAVSTGISMHVVVQMEVTRHTFHQKPQSMCYWHTVAWFIVSWGRQCHSCH